LVSLSSLRPIHHQAGKPVQVMAQLLTVAQLAALG
jgi:hypothetical protein